MIPLRSKNAKDAGYATMAVVATVSLVLLSMLTYTLLGNLNSFDAQARAQVKQDYSQKEDAILSALLHIVPNKAIGAMQENSAGNADHYTWETIFAEAATLGNAEQAADPLLLTSLDLSSAISGNSGDTEFDDVSDFVEAPVKTDDGTDNLVNGGNWWEYYMLGDPKIGPHIPAALQLTYDNYLLDKKYPVVSFDKSYVSWYQKGLNVSPTTYPRYNLLQYPDVKFGYKRPGELFVAKRNWWVFSLTFGKHNEEQTGIPSVTKNYVLSIYEIPSQLPLSSATLMQVGQFADGTDWANVTLGGGINANKIETSGTVALSGGAISARESVALSGTTTVESRSVTDGFDDLGGREDRALNSASDFHDASTGGNVGKVAFIPINPGFDFLKRGSDGSRSDRVSPTGWKDYSRGANQVAMRIEIREMAAEDDQMPVLIRFYYRNDTNSWSQIDYERGVNWPTELEAGGDAFPFQTDVLDNLRNAFVLNLDRLPTFLGSLGNAATIDRNHSIHISPNSSDPTVQEPSHPSVDSDVAVTLRGGKDMTAYTSGFSIVTNLRLYIGETLNAVTTTPPENSGIPVDATYYPPLSLFAPEKRFGESLSLIQPVTLEGQLGSLKTGSGDTFNPLELKTADEERVEADQVRAQLTALRSPADLPPINLMNWMVTIEEIH
ncbi:MAG: hypothetical protein WD342_09760 [Verrucomicrobiales bacterium]